MSHEIYLDPTLVHMGFQRHDSRASNPPPGNIVDRYVPLHVGALATGAWMKKQYFPNVLPRFVVTSDVPRAVMTAVYLWLDSQIIVSPYLGFQRGDNVWEEALGRLPVTATGKQCFEADVELVLGSTMAAHGVMSTYLKGLLPGQLVWGVSHCPIADTMQAYLQGEGIGSLNWPEEQFGSGAFILASFKRHNNGALGLVKVKYYPVLRPPTD